MRVAENAAVAGMQVKENGSRVSVVNPMTDLAQCFTSSGYSVRRKVCSEGSAEMWRSNSHRKRFGGPVTGL